MNIHHKNMKQVGTHMQAWTQKHLSSLGIYECTYNYFNLDEQLFMPIPMVYSWYCEYMEKRFDLRVAPRLKQGAHYWAPNSSLMKAYQANVDIKNCYKLDLIQPTANGYEMLIIGSMQPLSITQFKTLQFALNDMSSIAQTIRQDKPNLLLEFEAAPAVLEQMHSA